MLVRVGPKFTTCLIASPSAAAATTAVRRTVAVFSHLTSSSAATLSRHRPFAVSSRQPATKPNVSSLARPFSTSQSPAMKFPGGCYCRKVRYEIDLDDKDQARTSLCHCRNCKKFTGGPFGITTKIPKSSFTVTSGKDAIKVHEADNGGGTLLHREFCDECGSGLLEYGANAGDFIYIFYGTLDHPTDLPPKGEFFCSKRDDWMPEVPGIFHKQQIKE